MVSVSGFSSVVKRRLVKLVKASWTGSPFQQIDSMLSADPCMAPKITTPTEEPRETTTITTNTEEQVGEAVDQLKKRARRMTISAGAMLARKPKAE